MTASYELLCANWCQQLLRYEYTSAVAIYLQTSSSHSCDWAKRVELLWCEYTSAVAIHCHFSNSHRVIRPEYILSVKNCFSFCCKDLWVISMAFGTHLVCGTKCLLKVESLGNKSHTLVTQLRPWITWMWTLESCNPVGSYRVMSGMNWTVKPGTRYNTIPGTGYGVPGKRGYQIPLGIRYKRLPSFPPLYPVRGVTGYRGLPR